MTSKHITFILISSLFLLNTSLGQSLKNRAGIELGGAHSFLSSYEISGINSYSLGVYTDILRFNNWGVATGFYFQIKGGKNGEEYPDYKAYLKYKYNQWSIPLTAYYNLGEKISVHGGVYGGRNIPNTLYYNFSELTYFVIENKSDGNSYIDKAIRKFEWGSKFGIEFRAFKNTLTNNPLKHYITTHYIYSMRNIQTITE